MKIRPAQFTSEPISALNLPAFTGDATSTLGTSLLTLATVNANPGSFGSTSLSVPTLTIDAKGRVTASSQYVLGSAAGYATGTSGTTIPLLSGANIWSAAQTFGALSATTGSFTGLLTGMGVVRTQVSGDVNVILSLLQSGTREYSLGVRAGGTFVINNGGSFTGSDLFSISSSGVATLAGSLTVNAATTLSGGLTVTGGVNTTGGIVSNTSITSQGPLTVNGGLTANTATLSTPLAVASGGTGASTVSAALYNLSVAPSATADLTFTTGTHPTNFNIQGNTIQAGTAGVGGNTVSLHSDQRQLEVAVLAASLSGSGAARFGLATVATEAGYTTMSYQWTKNTDGTFSTYDPTNGFVTPTAPTGVTFGSSTRFAIILDGVTATFQANGIVVRSVAANTTGMTFNAAVTLDTTGAAISGMIYRHYTDHRFSMMSGPVSATTGSFSGAITGTSATLSAGLTAASATIGGVATFSTPSAFPGTAVAGTAYSYASSGNGLVLYGQGSTYDVGLYNRGGSLGLAVSANTQNVTFGANITVPGTAAITGALSSASVGTGPLSASAITATTVSTSGTATFSGSITAPSGTLTSATQASPRLILSGQEFYQASYTDTNGVAMLLGVNRTSNRQFWFADSSLLTQNATNPTFWVGLIGSAVSIGARATDGATALPLTINPAGGPITLVGSSTFNNTVSMASTLAVTGGMTANNTSTINSAGSPLLLNVTTANGNYGVKINLQDAGTNTGFIGSNTTYAFLVARPSDAATIFSISPAGGVYFSNTLLSSVSSGKVLSVASRETGNEYLALGRYGGLTASFESSITDTVLYGGKTRAVYTMQGAVDVYNYQTDLNGAAVAIGVRGQVSTTQTDGSTANTNPTAGSGGTIAGYFANNSTNLGSQAVGVYGYSKVGNPLQIANASGNVFTVAQSGTATIAYNQGTFSSTGNSALAITNSSSTGQSPIDFFFSGTLKARLRGDYAGNLNHVAVGGAHCFYTGGDAGSTPAIISSSGVQTSVPLYVMGTNNLTLNFDTTGGWIQSYQSRPLNLNPQGNAVTVGSSLTAGGVIVSGSGSGFQNAGYVVNARNRIWSFANADSYGLSYFQGTSASGSNDSIGLHFNNVTGPASLYEFTATGPAYFRNTSGLVSSGSVVSAITRTSKFASTPGTAAGNVHLTPGSSSGGTSNATGSALTFGGSGTNYSVAQAGIYVNADDVLGTYLSLATTNSYATGPQFALTIDNLGNTTINRGNFTTGSTNYLNSGATYLTSSIYVGGTLQQFFTSAARPGAMRLYRNDNDSNYNVQTSYDGSRWLLQGYSGDTFHAMCRVGFSDNTGTITGYGPSVTTAANSVVIRDGAGSVYGNHYYQSGFNSQLVGQYDPTQTRGLYAIGSGYLLPTAPSSGTYGNFYGIAYSYEPNYSASGNNPQSKTGLSHQTLFMAAGVTTTAIGNGIWTSGASTFTSTLNVSGVTTLGSPINFTSGGSVGNVSMGYYLDTVNTAIRTNGTHYFQSVSGGANYGSINSAGMVVGSGSLTPVSRFSVLSTDAGTFAQLGSWNSAYTAFGPNVGSSTGAALGVGYSSSIDSSFIYSIAPNVAWKPLYIGANNHVFYVAGSGASSFSLNAVGVNDTFVQIGSTGSGNYNGYKIGFQNSYARMRQLDFVNDVGLFTNIDGNNNLDSTSYSSWKMRMGSGSEAFTVARAPANSTAFTRVFSTDLNGNSYLGGTLTLNVNNGAVQNYGEGLRIVASSGGYACIAMGADSSGSGTITGQWNLVRNSGNGFEFRNGASVVWNTDSSGNFTHSGNVYFSSPLLMNNATSHIALNRSRLYLAGYSDTNHMIGSQYETNFGTSDGETYRYWQYLSLRSAQTGYYAMLANGANNQLFFDQAGAGSTFSGNVSAPSFNGFVTDQGASNNSIAVRQGAGYLYATYFNQSSGNGENPSISQVMVTNGGDNFTRKASIAFFGQQLAANGGSFTFNSPQVFASPNNGTQGGIILLGNSSSGYGYFQFVNNANSAQWGYLRCDSGGNLFWSGAFTANGNITAYSDATLKTNVRTITGALDRVNAMRGVWFNRIDTNVASSGVIAQEIEPIVPELVQTDREGLKSVAYANMAGYFIEAIKELTGTVNELKARIKELESKQ